MTSLHNSWKNTDLEDETRYFMEISDKELKAQCWTYFGCGFAAGALVMIIAFELLSSVVLKYYL
jgi:hypothetical protein